MMATVAADNGTKSTTGPKKGSSCGGGGGGGTGSTAGHQPPEQGIKCPRCNSPNTKFCYYNNYSLTQPRHFCKSCRRYWTKGGALRNVPVGGGSRKNKKNRSSSSASSSFQSSSKLLSLSPLDAIAGMSEPPNPATGLKFLTHTAIDFHLGFVPFSRLQHPAVSQFNSSACFSASGGTSNAAGSNLAGFSYPIGGSSSNGTSCSNYGSIASSIESLSSINQNLHWRLQQQRLAMFIGGDARIGSAMPAMENPVEPSCFGVDESNKGEIFWDSADANGSRKTCDTGTAWFLDGSFAMPASEANNVDIANSGNAVNEWNGITAWNDVQQFTALP
ncbi:hypothetical protein HPP92_007772 [Vanilla planifolia]|uniref:Dof zinc finger protein n=1 Tax=Vanilla planifolia TaxID=51239 RepID=A0A835RGN7_VANPL|nr:hypothetical protein HPP92_007927 [Vanilla planifolia]KAG0490909.1 hypothetical protein HPP92_007772 [Vanilla planifolia]